MSDSPKSDEKRHPVLQRMLKMPPTPHKPKGSDKSEPFEQRHKDGSLWAKGQTKGGLQTGYWEWFRKDGTKLRSGSFEDGQQVGEWTTYDASGEVYKVTRKSRTGKS